MSLSESAQKILGQLAVLLDQISTGDYSRPSETLGGATIGQHIRHTLEFFSCLEAGCLSGVVNYEKRAHDMLLECDKAIALERIDSITAFVSELKGNRALLLELTYISEADLYERVDTSMLRELVYNVEHAIHHMAMIRMALREIAPDIIVDDDFGIAASTVRYRRKNAVHSQ